MEISKDKIILSKVRSGLAIVKTLSEETSKEHLTLQEGLKSLRDEILNGADFDTVKDKIKSSRKGFHTIGFKYADIDAYLYRCVLLYEALEDIDSDMDGLSEEQIDTLKKTKVEISSSKPFYYQLKDEKLELSDKESYDNMVAVFDEMLENEDYLKQQYYQLRIQLNGDK